MGRILVVEDQEEVRTMLCLFLKRAGHQVDEAPDGRSALSKFHKEQPDLVLTDLLMPKKSGLELISDLLGDLPDTKIIAISGDSRGLEEARRLGAMRTFVKPLSPAILLQTIRDILANGHSTS